VTGLIFVVLGGIFILLGLKTGFKPATHVVTPVILSLMGTVGLLGLFMPFNLFHVMGLLLVLCIGIDYALFLFWRKPGSTKELLLLGNGLAAVTTILSFGLLAFSQTKAVYSFGLSVFLGILLCFIVTTLFLGARRPSHES
jgi:predicted exporter